MVTTNAANPKLDEKTTEIKEDLQRYSEELYQLMQGEGESSDRETEIKYAVEELEDIPMAAEAALNDDHRSAWPPYINDMVDQVSRGLNGKSPEDLLREVKRLARKNPTLVLAGGVAVGVALALVTSHMLSDD